MIRGQWGNERWRGLVSRAPGKISCQKHQVATTALSNLGQGVSQEFKESKSHGGRRGQRTWALIATVSSSGPENSHASVPTFLKWGVTLNPSLSQRMITLLIDIWGQSKVKEKVLKEKPPKIFHCHELKIKIFCVTKLRPRMHLSDQFGEIQTPRAHRL